MFHHESWKPIYFGVKRPKVKVTKHKDKSVSRFIIIIIIISLQAERNIIVAAYVSNAGFSLLQCPAAQAMLTIPGFPCVTSPLPVLPYVEFFAVSKRQKYCRRGSYQSSHCWFLLV